MSCPERVGLSWWKMAPDVIPFAVGRINLELDGDDGGLLPSSQKSSGEAELWSLCSSLVSWLLIGRKSKDLWGERLH